MVLWHSVVVVVERGPMYVRNREPSLDELLNDPVTRLVMARDGFSDEAVRTLLQETRRRLMTRDNAQPAVAATA